MTTNKKPSNPRMHNPDGVFAPEARNEDCVTLRDIFANSAMQGFISLEFPNICGNNGLPIPQLVSELSYEFADAMLRQREKTATE